MVTHVPCYLPGLPGYPNALATHVPVSYWLLRTARTVLYAVPEIHLPSSSLTFATISTKVEAKLNLNLRGSTDTVDSLLYST